MDMPISSPSGLRVIDVSGSVVAVPLAIEASGPAAIAEYIAAMAAPAPAVPESPVVPPAADAHPAQSDTPPPAE